MALDHAISRRSFLKGTGALIVAFSMPVDLRGQPATPPPSPVGPSANQIDSWLAVAQDGTATVFCGKVELGTGVETALRQIVAEELDLPFAQIRWVQGDTATTVDQGATTGSQTIKQGGAQLRLVAAEARQVLLELASTRFGVPPEQLIVTQGVISAQGDPSKKASYGELIGGRRFNRVVTGTAKPKSSNTYALVGTSVPRVDIPGKAVGTYTYTHDIHLPGMLHGRVIRPVGVGSALKAVDEDSIRQLPGQVRVVRKGNFLAVVAEREEQAVRAAQALKVSWQQSLVLPEMSRSSTSPASLPVLSA